jgi:hypothetical protein
MYARSDDGGDTWSEPVEIDNAARPDYILGYGPTLIDVETHGEDEVHLIWDGAPTVERNHVWSADGGNTWSERTLLFPEITNVGRAGWNDMVFDSAGILHAVALGQPWHASWSKGAWSKSDAIGQGFSAESMRLAQGLGNQLHVVWVNWVNEQDHTVWYARGLTSAPSLPAATLPRPPATPVPTTGIAPDGAAGSSEPLADTAVEPAPRAVPNANPPAGSVDDVTVLLVGIAPALLVVGIALAVQIRRLRRRW